MSIERESVCMCVYHVGDILELNGGGFELALVLLLLELIAEQPPLADLIQHQQQHRCSSMIVVVTVAVYRMLAVPPQ